MSINIADEITAEYNKYIREVIDYDSENNPITRLDIGGIVSAVTFAASYQIASNKRAARVTELEAQLTDAKQVANDCRIVADNAIAEALQSKELIRQLVEAFKQDRIEWDDFPPSSLLAFSKLTAPAMAEGKA